MKQIPDSYQCDRVIKRKWKDSEGQVNVFLLNCVQRDSQLDFANIMSKATKHNRKKTHVLDGLTSSTFRSNWCHDGVVVEGVSGDICFPLKPSTNHVCATRREASYKISRSHGSERESKQRWWYARERLSEKMESFTDETPGAVKERERRRRRRRRRDEVKKSKI